MRREHPRWGSRRIRLEMLRKPGPWFRGDLVVPSERTIDRILQRQGLLRSRPRKRSKDTGVIMVAGQKIALGRLHQHRTLTVTVSDTTLAIDLGDGDVKVVRRTNTEPVRSIKGQRPRIATSVS